MHSFNKNCVTTDRPGRGFLLGLCGCSALIPAIPAHAGNDKPDIILIITDEHNASVMGCMGNPYIDTPNLDALAGNGILFTSHYCASPISVPSRQTITTGKYVSRHTMWSNAAVSPDNVPSLPRVMQTEGYQTVLVGGMHYKGMNYGWDKYTEKKGLHTPKPKNPEGVPVPNKKRVDASTFKKNGETLEKEFTQMGAADMTQSTDAERTADAVSFLRNRKDTGKPLFLLVGLHAPHYPLHSTAELIEKYKGRVPLPEVPEGYTDSLPLNYRHLRNERNFENVTEQTARFARECYYARVEWIDSKIGEILRTLEETGRADNTIVIYTSDHGENIGEHGLWWKNCLYDCGARVPLIISCPSRWKGGQVRDKANGSVDLVRTITDIAGAQVPSDWDGDSMLGYLDNPESRWKDWAVCEYYADYVCSGIAMYRKGKWKYVHHNRADSLHGPEIELYDLGNDPGEFHNLAAKEEYADLVRQLHKELCNILGEDPEDTELRYRSGCRK
ncbi:MAG: sulfatase-like hydrolase/transferase [Candidatus Cryptobacteroides sp.]